jgi:alpha-mannosidase
MAIEGFPLAVGSVKRAEEGNALIVRLNEPHGARGTARLRFSNPIARVDEVNLLEEPVASESTTITHEGNSVRVGVRPFQVLTLRVQ